ncbi:GNAT family N-acetyltransferase [Paucidesulfovibrio longus]|uniref:GNAT family N-acetyltransferase n=1 Tax=Paucidesulfovibrio longus TaxID=889 RepID=UPI0003B4D57E|nr:GNAT family N-acetyltransferase [Paucidesulfovibrio longus]
MNEPMIRPLPPEDLPQAMRLVREVFQRHVAPEFSPAGIQEFSSFTTDESAQERRNQGHVFLAARIGDDLAGVAEVRDHNHICMLFVRDDRRCSGIGRLLVRTCADLCRQVNPSLAQITVNASPNAVGAYLRFGFLPTDQEQLHNGIRFTPMALKLP